MIDLKLIRKYPQLLDDSLKKRNCKEVSKEILELDKEVKNLLLLTENIKAERNKLSKEIGMVKLNKGDISDLLLQVEKSKNQESELEQNLKQKQKELHDFLLYIPNILDESVPFGVDERSNKVVRNFMEIPKFSFTPKSHDDLGISLKMMDFKTAAKISGSRFVILKKDLCKLERSLTNFMLDKHIKEHGFTEYNVPVLVNEDSLIGTSQLPKFANEMFKTNYNDKWLISTSEIPLTNMVKDSIIEADGLPLRFVAKTECFRSEAGSAGKDTKGMLRQHQFSKVEMVSIVESSKSKDELEHITNSAENILKALKIPYRVVLLCSGDTGFSASKTYDIEAWIPSQNTYREISSCSLCTDFQARRLKARMKNKNDKSTNFIHTLNGSGLAVGRTLLAIMENYQQEDGGIIIPEVLIPYMGGQKIILNKY